MIVWTHAVLGVSFAYVLYFSMCTCAAHLSMFHMERHSRYMLIIILIIILMKRLLRCCRWLTSQSKRRGIAASLASQWSQDSDFRQWPSGCCHKALRAEGSVIKLVGLVSLLCDWMEMMFVGCSMSQQQATVSQGRTDFTCCHAEREIAHQTF